ncbi:hypothetical protein [Hydrogenispora ethanolica]|nr:hypothetical protein [Hydrogenispora ethanolica]
MTPEAVADFLIVGLPLVTAGGVYAMTATALYLTTRYRDNRLAQALVVLDEVVISVVKELNQTVVDDLKKARADGKLTREEAEQIKKQAVELVMSRLGAGLPRILQKTFGPLFDLVSTKIEATLYDLKKGRQSPRQQRPAGAPARPRLAAVR